jgi:SAM-dependent methyltransferase
VIGQELEKLAAVERSHWFYRGKRRIVCHWLRRLGIGAHSGRLVIDVGAGTGQLLAELAEQGYRTLGIEFSPDGLRLARASVSSPLVGGSALDLPLAEECADAIVALDVIEHLSDDRRAIEEMERALRPGGFLVISVPAFQALWSDWDVALGHHRRYRRDSLLRAVDLPSLRVVHIAYTNWLAFLPIWIYRRWRTVFPGTGATRLEDGVPPRWINAIFEAALVSPACWPWFHPPFGVSLLCVLEKPIGSRSLQPDS